MALRVNKKFKELIYLSRNTQIFKYIQLMFMHWTLFKSWKRISEKLTPSTLTHTTIQGCNKMWTLIAQFIGCKFSRCICCFMEIGLIQTCGYFYYWRVTQSTLIIEDIHAYTKCTISIKRKYSPLTTCIFSRFSEENMFSGLGTSHGPKTIQKGKQISHKVLYKNT